jgi:hypothetical protein
MDEEITITMTRRQWCDVACDLEYLEFVLGERKVGSGVSMNLEPGTIQLWAELNDKGVAP